MRPTTYKAMRGSRPGRGDSRVSGASAASVLAARRALDSALGAVLALRSRAWASVADQESVATPSRGRPARSPASGRPRGVLPALALAGALRQRAAWPWPPSQVGRRGPTEPSLEGTTTGGAGAASSAERERAKAGAPPPATATRAKEARQDPPPGWHPRARASRPAALRAAWPRRRSWAQRSPMLATLRGPPGSPGGGDLAGQDDCIAGREPPAHGGRPDLPVQVSTSPTRPRRW